MTETQVSVFFIFHANTNLLGCLFFFKASQPYILPCEATNYYHEWWHELCEISHPIYPSRFKCVNIFLYFGKAWPEICHAWCSVLVSSRGLICCQSRLQPHTDLELSARPGFTEPTPLKHKTAREASTWNCSFLMQNVEFICWKQQYCTGTIQWVVGPGH